MGTHDRLGRRGRNTKRGTWKPVRGTKHGDMTKTEREIQERGRAGDTEREEEHDTRRYMETRR